MGVSLRLLVYLLFLATIVFDSWMLPRHRCIRRVFSCLSLNLQNMPFLPCWSSSSRVSSYAMPSRCVCIVPCGQQVDAVKRLLWETAFTLHGHIILLPMLSIQDPGGALTVYYHLAGIRRGVRSMSQLGLFHQQFGALLGVLAALSITIIFLPAFLPLLDSGLDV